MLLVCTKVTCRMYSLCYAACVIYTLHVSILFTWYACLTKSLHITWTVHMHITQYTRYIQYILENSILTSLPPDSRGSHFWNEDVQYTTFKTNELIQFEDELLQLGSCTIQFLRSYPGHSLFGFYSFITTLNDWGFLEPLIIVITPINSILLAIDESTKSIEISPNLITKKWNKIIDYFTGTTIASADHWGYPVEQENGVVKGNIIVTPIKSDSMKNVLRFSINQHNSQKLLSSSIPIIL